MNEAQESMTQEEKRVQITELKIENNTDFQIDTAEQNEGFENYKNHDELTDEEKLQILKIVGLC